MGETAEWHTDVTRTTTTHLCIFSPPSISQLTDHSLAPLNVQTTRRRAACHWILDGDTALNVKDGNNKASFIAVRFPLGAVLF